MNQSHAPHVSRTRYWLFQLSLALLWCSLALANVYSQQGQLQAVCFIPAGLSMALFMSYGAGALPAVILGSFTAFLIGSQNYIPGSSPLYHYLIAAAFYAVGHSLCYYFSARLVRRSCGGFFRLEKPAHMFKVLYTSLLAAGISAFFGTQGLDFLVPVTTSVWIDGFLMRWLATLTGILCFALSFITLLAFFRCERSFNHLHIDTHHLRRGLTLDQGLPVLILIQALATFYLDWLGNYTGVPQFTVAWMGIVSLFLLAWAALKMSYGAVSVLVAAFSLTLLITLSAFWANFHVANVQILLPLMAISGTFIWSLSSSESSNKVLHQLANTDELTGLANRRQWFHIAQQEFARIQRHQGELCVILIDLDHFKKINDSYGHQIGDLALQHAASMMQSQLRGESTLCRYGGEEFALLLPECQMEMAYMAAERVRRTLQNSQLKTSKVKIKLTASLGVAYSYGQDLRLEEVITRADEALYLAKSEGRNRVCPEPAPHPDQNYHIRSSGTTNCA